MVDKNRQEKTREIWIKNKIGTVTLQKEMKTHYWFTDSYLWK